MRISTWVITLLVLGVGCSIAPNEERSPEPTVGGSAPLDPRSVQFVGRTKVSAGMVGSDRYPAPLPSGRGVIFSSDRHSRHFKLYLHGSEAGGTLKLTQGVGDDIYPTVAPDGGRAIFASDRDGHFRLYQIESLTGAATPRPLTEAGVNASHPSYDASGDRVAYMRESPRGEWEVWILSLSDGTERFITAGLFPEFHPRQNHLVFQRARDRDERWYSIYLFDIERGWEQELVVGADWGAVHPSFSPDGNWIVFNSVGRSGGDASSGDFDRELWAITDRGQQRIRLTPTDRIEENPVWARDGQIYFTSKNGERDEIWRFTPRLPKLPAVSQQPRRFSPSAPLADGERSR